MSKINQIKDESEKNVILELKNKFRLGRDGYSVDEYGHVIKLDLADKNLKIFLNLLETYPNYEN